jgi:hypothetical protein
MSGDDVDPMLRSLKNLEQYKVSATDGDIGSVANFLMDDARWAECQTEPSLRREGVAVEFRGRP